MLFNREKEIEKIVKAMEDGKPEAIRDSLTALFDGAEKASAEKVENLEATIAEMNAVNSGKKKMSKARIDFAKSLIADLDPQNSISGQEIPIPEETKIEVLDNLTEGFEVLEVCDVQAVNGDVTTITNIDTTEKAVWGDLFSGLTKELSMGVAKSTVGLKKLSAWIPVPHDYRRLGINYMDEYATTKLTESAKNAIADSIANGLTSDGPLSMVADLTKGTTGADGVTVTYTKKAAIEVTEFTPEVFGALKVQLNKAPNGKHRAVGNVFLMVNPDDYETKIVPATTILTPMGTYSTGVLPVNCKIITNNYIPEGEAIFGCIDGYQFAVGFGGNSGAIRFDDSVKFMEDARVYATTMIANGRPKDNGSFLRLDISKLTTPSIKVVMDSATE